MSHTPATPHVDSQTLASGPVAGHTGAMVRRQLVGAGRDPDNLERCVLVIEEDRPRPARDWVGPRIVRRNILVDEPMARACRAILKILGPVGLESVRVNA